MSPHLHAAGTRAPAAPPLPAVAAREPAQTVTIVVGGPLVVSNCHVLRQRIRDLLAAGDHHFTIDCARCRYMDGAGLGALVSCLASIRRVHGTMRLTNMCDDLVTLFALARLDSILTPLEDHRAA